MINTSVALKIACGVFAIIAIAGSAGCATQRPVMNSWDLDHFWTDCSRKQEQIEFLQSLRTTPDDQARAALARIISLDARRSWELDSIASGRTNWIINQHLMALSRCP